MESVQTTIRFPPRLLERVDALAALGGKTRAAWIKYQVERAVDEAELQQATAIRLTQRRGNHHDDH